MNVKPKLMSKNVRKASTSLAGGRRSNPSISNSTSHEVSTPVDSNDDDAVQKYIVLYYKRSNKVHKTKGTSRLDGILTIHAPPSCLVKLSPETADGESDFGGDDNDDDDSDDDSDNDGGKKMSFKKKMQARRKKMQKNTGRRSSSSSSSKSSSDIIYAKVNFDVARHVFQKGYLEEDEIVVLPAWECQIVERKTAMKPNNNSNNTKSTNGFQHGARPQIGVQKNAVLSSSNNRGGGSMISRRPLHSKARSASLRGTATAMTRKSQPPPSENIHPNMNTSNTSVTVKAVKRKQPKQFHKHHDSASEESSSEEEGQMQTLTTSTSMRAKGFSISSALSSSLGRGVGSSKKRKLGKASLAGKVSKLGGIAKKLQNDDIFAGAIGHLHAPGSIKAILRPHQQIGVVFLWNCLTGVCPKLRNLVVEKKATDTAKKRIEGGMNEIECCGAILADDMGLGKTLMTITTICALHRRDRDNRFVVVCPSSLVGNWAKEFDKFVGKASQPRRVVIRKGGGEGLQKIKAFILFKRQRSEVLIISYDFFRMHSKLLSQASNIGLLVVDEGHRLKNTSGSLTLTALNSLDCDARLLITGTPIQNNLSEFYNVVNFVLPGILGDLNNFRRVYERPLAAAEKRNATKSQRETGKVINRELHAITSTFMLRRLQKDILVYMLPPRFESLLFCRPSKVQCHLYKEIVGKGQAGDSLTTLTNLRKLCSHPDLLHTDTHNYYKEKSLNVLSDSGKLEVLESLLDAIHSECPTDKVVIVSNYTSALTVIEKSILNSKGWPSLRLDGTVAQSARQALVDSFNRSGVDKSFVFLLSSKAGGCGLNLIGGNRLIMVDPDWNPSTDLQAMARIYRHGQTKQCHIYRLFTTGTVEEVIFQRQTQKNNLDKSRQSSNRFTDEELKDCFTLKENCSCDTQMKVGEKWPGYDGQNSLVEQGIHDIALLQVAQMKRDTLTYVHPVKDTMNQMEEDEQPFDEVMDDVDESSVDHFCESSDEAEFEE